MLDLQYRERMEYVVGHNVAAEPTTFVGERCTRVRTRWIPRTEVRLMDAREVANVTVGMESLAELEDADDRLRYTPSDCFENFPFSKPSPKAEIPALEGIGKELYETRAAFMIDTDQASRRPTTPSRTRRSRSAPSTASALSTSAPSTRHGPSRPPDLRHRDGRPHVGRRRDPPFTTPDTPAEKDLHQRFEDHVLDKLFEINALRARQ